MVFFVSACHGRQSNKPTGAECQSDAECRQGNLCQYGRCRAECNFDRDCSEGSACIASQDDPTQRVCTLLNEGSCSSTTCPAGLYCGADGICHEGCEEDAHCGAGRACAPDDVCYETCGEDGDCAKGRSCIAGLCVITGSDVSNWNVPVDDAGLDGNAADPEGDGGPQGDGSTEEDSATPEPDATVKPDGSDDPTNPVNDAGGEDGTPGKDDGGIPEPVGTSTTHIGVSSGCTPFTSDSTQGCLSIGGMSVIGDRESESYRIRLGLGPAVPF